MSRIHQEYEGAERRKACFYSCGTNLEVIIPTTTKRQKASITLSLQAGLWK